MYKLLAWCFTYSILPGNNPMRWPHFMFEDTRPREILSKSQIPNSSSILFQSPCFFQPFTLSPVSRNFSTVQWRGRGGRLQYSIGWSDSTSLGGWPLSKDLKGTKALGVEMNEGMHPRCIQGQIRQRCKGRSVRVGLRSVREAGVRPEQGEQRGQE